METKVLSIQSHVVHGYVGNRCAIFPLQLHGFEVDFINSVQFSNHTAYQHFKGQVMSSNELQDLFEGLKLNSLDKGYTHVLTGYIADVSFLTQLAQTIRELRQNNPGLFYICDPVLGDADSYYVTPALMPLFKTHLLPLANIITPNLFELGQLSGVQINSEKSCLEAIDTLHAVTTTIVVSSTNNLCPKPGVMYGYASTRGGGKFRFEIPLLKATFLGTGDLFATLLLAWFTKSEGDLKMAVKNTLSSMQDLLKKTLDEAEEMAKLANLDHPTPEMLELKIVKYQEILKHPKSEVNIVEL